MKPRSIAWFGCLVAAWGLDSSTARGADAAALPVEIAPDNLHVTTLGRFAPNGSGMDFAWPGSRIEFAFNGTDANILLLDGAPGGAHPVEGKNNNYFDVSVDDATPFLLALETGTTIYRVASNLTLGPHRVSVYKRTESFVGKVTFLGLQLSAAGEMAELPAPLDRRIEIVGDSISAGYGDEATDETVHFSPLTENNRLAYGPVAARLLQAQAVTIAWSGIGVARDYDGNTTNQMPQRWRRILPDDTTDTWDFSAWIPDVVVINLGTNDMHLGDPGGLFETDYRALLRDVRNRYPNAHIICCVGPLLTGGDLSIMRSHVQNALTSFADAKTSFLELPSIDSSEGYGADGHPSIATHARMAEQLAWEIAGITGWLSHPPNGGGFVKAYGTHLKLNGGDFFFRRFFVRL